MHPPYKHSIFNFIKTIINQPFRQKVSKQGCCFLFPLQVSENAKQDLKDGLALYNSENNIGLRNAWNIIQAEVGRPHTETLAMNVHSL